MWKYNTIQIIRISSSSVCRIIIFSFWKGSIIALRVITSNGLIRVSTDIAFALEQISLHLQFFPVLSFVSLLMPRKFPNKYLCMPCIIFWSMWTNFIKMKEREREREIFPYLSLVKLTVKVYNFNVLTTLKDRKYPAFSSFLVSLCFLCSDHF